MTPSREPKTPSKSGKSASPGRSYKTPFSRRLKYFFQDTGYAAKKAVRRAADPVRDAKSRPPRPKREGKAAPKSAPAADREPVRGARELGERPATAGENRERRSRRRARLAGPKAERQPRRRPRAERRRQSRGDRPKQRARAAGVAAAITGFGERASRLIGKVLAPVIGVITKFGAIIARALHALSNAVTPLRAAVAVTALAAILLIVSQFVDYRGVAVGVPDYAAYSDVEVVAPPPQVDRQTAGSAHAYLLVPVALVALAALVACLRGRWQFGRLISLLGILAIAVTLIVDVPAGLDEGAQAVAYAGVEAKLIEGFYVQLVSAVILVVGGLMVAHYARADGSRSPRKRRRERAVAPARARAA